MGAIKSKAAASLNIIHNRSGSIVVPTSSIQAAASGYSDRPPPE